MKAGTGVRVVKDVLSDGSEVFSVEVTFPQGTTVVFEMDSEKSAVAFEYAFGQVFNGSEFLYFSDAQKIVGIGLKVN